MARPIRETPILFGDEARRFETQMLNPKPLSAERQARMPMNKEDIVLRRLGEEDVISKFDCGDEDLNDFIFNDALLYYKVRLATSYVLEDKNTKDTIGYFSLAHDRISLTDFPTNSAYNRFRKQFFAQGKMFKSYPALKICRLATDKKFRGEGLGTMMVNMIITSYKSDNKAGCRFITVDAYAEALPFYYKLGFLPLSKEDEDAPTRLLYFDLESYK